MTSKTEGEERGYPITLGFRVKSLPSDNEKWFSSQLTTQLLKTVFERLRDRDGVKGANFKSWKEHYGITSSGKVPQLEFARWCFTVLKHHNIHFDLDDSRLKSDMDVAMKRLKHTMDTVSQESKHARIQTSCGDKSSYDVFTSFGTRLEPFQDEVDVEDYMNPAETFTYAAMMGKIYYHAPSDYVRKSKITLCAQDVPKSDFQFIFDEVVLSSFSKDGQLVQSKNANTARKEDTMSERQFSDGYRYYWLVYATHLPKRELAHIVKDYTNYVTISKATQDSVNTETLYRDFTRSLIYISFVARCIQHSQLWFGQFCDILGARTIKNNSSYIGSVIRNKSKSSSPMDVVVQLLPHRRALKDKKHVKRSGHSVLSRKKHANKKIVHTWEFRSGVKELAETVNKDRETLKTLAEQTPDLAVANVLPDAAAAASLPRSSVSESDDVEDWLDDDWEEGDKESGEASNVTVVSANDVNLVSEKLDSVAAQGPVVPPISDLRDSKELVEYDAAEASKADKKKKKKMMMMANDWRSDKKIQRALRKAVESHLVVISPVKTTNACEGPDCYAPIPLCIPDIMDVSKLMNALNTGKRESIANEDDIFGAGGGGDEYSTVAGEDGVFERAVADSVIPLGVNIRQTGITYKVWKLDGDAVKYRQRLVECATSGSHQ